MTGGWDLMVMVWSGFFVLQLFLIFQINEKFLESLNKVQAPSNNSRKNFLKIIFNRKVVFRGKTWWKII
jgi:hypothetical protein